MNMALGTQIPGRCWPLVLTQCCVQYVLCVLKPANVVRCRVTPKKHHLVGKMTLVSFQLILKRTVCVLFGYELDGVVSEQGCQLLTKSTAMTQILYL